MRIVLPILIGTLLLVLWWFNPNEDQFAVFLTDELRAVAGNAGEQAGEAAGGAVGFLTGRLGRAVGDAAGRAAGREASGLFERENYGIASTYELDLNGRREGGEWVFLGIAGQFVPIKQPEDLQTLVRDQIAR
ncbi:hypothetical protein [Rubricoccus marinus]|uniref:DUF4359 domain-containing protein n=1 Tax=Rubricoccus marinus TaxID=716817 RepID=A0A259U2X1_9BACT|nr:hypothetical protein [Rubricoccus marinus]OZC04178.1 hypothetical protein BSZ36_15020 [Rubricoccus marinus]